MTYEEIKEIVASNGVTSWENLDENFKEEFFEIDKTLYDLIIISSLRPYCNAVPDCSSCIFSSGKPDCVYTDNLKRHLYLKELRKEYEKRRDA